MKQVVFSFDDGLLDFYQNVFPVLRKNKISATVNVITGFSDKTLQTNCQYCSIEHIREMSNYGIEIAMHSNSHQILTSYEDLDTCIFKINDWLIKQPNGLVLPFNKEIRSEILEWCLANDVKYIRTKANNKRTIYTYLIRILFKLKLLSYSKRVALLNCRSKKQKNIFIFNSIEILNSKSPDFYLNIVDVLPKNSHLILMFHSIYKDVDEYKKISYKNGAWSLENFEILISKLLSKNIKIVTNKTLIKK